MVVHARKCIKAMKLGIDRKSKKQPADAYSHYWKWRMLHPERALENFNRYGVDAVMIGRAAIGRPWFFSEIKHFLKRRAYSNF